MGSWSADAQRQRQADEKAITTLLPDALRHTLHASLIMVVMIGAGAGVPHLLHLLTAGMGLHHVNDAATRGRGLQLRNISLPTDMRGKWEWLHAW